MPAKKNVVNNIVIVFRKDTLEAQKLAQQLALWLEDKKLKVFSHPKQNLSKKTKKWPAKKSFKSCGLVIVLGGDGTYLEAVRMLDGQETPILGVNMGSLGFLTQTKVEDLYQNVELALCGKMEKRPRSMLQAIVKRKGRIRLDATALNDIVVERGGLSHLINMDMFNEKNLVGRLKADGLIVSTPTGSTAYNLAAGGPILHPSVSAITVTPICPHSLTNRPILFHDTVKLIFKLLENTAILTCDGISKYELTPEDELVIRQSKCHHYVLRKPTDNYFNLLREKLKFSERD